ncbi:MAG TPA: hypothetical protein VKS79_05505, partial [Gemmataceae bacterium]|nr:hypothetical protein [Gemmataceae bacterium]
PTEKSEDGAAKSLTLKLLGVLKAADEKAKADDPKPKPTEAKPAEKKPKIELEFKIVPNAKSDEPKPESKPEKPEELKAKVARLKEELQKAAEAEVKEAKEKLMQQKEELRKAAEALAEAAKKANAPQKADEPKPADAKPEKAEDAKTAERARLFLRLMSEAEKKAKTDEAKPAKPGEPQPKPKAVEVQLQYRTAKDSDADQKLQKLEAQLQALLKEIQAMRAAKPGWEKKPIVQPTTPEQKKVLRAYEEEKPRVLVVPVQLAAPPSAKPQPTPAPGAPVPVHPPAEAVERRTIRARLMEARDGGDVISLTRTTYTLPPASAKALDDFLKTQVKAKVLETKVEGDKLTVTTTPDVQHIIAQFIALMQGKTPVTVAPGAGAPVTVGNDEGWLRLSLGQPVKEGEMNVIQLAPSQKPTEVLRLWLENKPVELKEGQKIEPQKK